MFRAMLKMGAGSGGFANYETNVAGQKGLRRHERQIHAVPAGENRLWANLPNQPDQPRQNVTQSRRLQDMHGYIFGHSAQEWTVYQMGGDMKLEILAADVAEQSKEDALYASSEDSRYEEDDLVAGRLGRHI
jgi:hypothetical protein